MMPAPVAVAYTLLIVLPTIKLIAALISRRSWRRIRALEAELEADEAYTDTDRRIIRQRVREAFGHPALMLLPFAVPIAMPIAAAVFAFTGIGETDPKATERSLERIEADHQRIEDLLRGTGYRPISKALFRDPRMVELSDLSFPLAFLRYPLATLCTLVALVLTAWMPMISLGVHYGSKYIFLALRDVARTNTLAPLFSMRETFGTLR